MRAVLSRVSEASVTVGDTVVGGFRAAGLLALVGVSDGDDDTDVAVMVRKIAELRILRDETSVADSDSPVLVVSQFTLMGSTAKGRRPSWSRAARPEDAEPLVARVIGGLRARGVTVETGEFGATMQVHSVNDGPFTVLVDTRSRL